jgi:hypothetical protein
MESSNKHTHRVWFHIHTFRKVRTIQRRGLQGRSRDWEEGAREANRDRSRGGGMRRRRSSILSTSPEMCITPGDVEHR